LRSPKSYFAQRLKPPLAGHEVLRYSHAKYSPQEEKRQHRQIELKAPWSDLPQFAAMPRTPRSSAASAAERFATTYQRKRFWRRRRMLAILQRDSERAAARATTDRRYFNATATEKMYRE